MFLLFEQINTEMDIMSAVELSSNTAETGNTTLNLEFHLAVDQAKEAYRKTEEAIQISQEADDINSQICMLQITDAKLC